MELKEYIAFYVLGCASSMYLIGNLARGDASTRQVLGLVFFWPLTLVFYALVGLYHGVTGILEVFTGKDNPFK
jgi:hypothetical protein